MDKVSPSCVKKVDKIASSSCDLSLAISQASKEIKLTKAHGFIKTPHIIIWKSLMAVIEKMGFLMLIQYSECYRKYILL